MKKNGGDQMDTLKILVVDDESRMRKLSSIGLPSTVDRCATLSITMPPAEITSSGLF